MTRNNGPRDLSRCCGWVFFGVVCLALRAWAAGDSVPDPTAPFGAAPVAASAVGGKAAVHKAPAPWVLQAILHSDQGKKAMLNGRWLQEADTYQGWRVQKIDDFSLVLTSGKQQRTLRLHPRLNESLAKPNEQ
jgi:hypothetical protein